MSHKPTLIISSWYSKCSECGRGANPHEETHDTVLGYSVTPGTVGCGVRWQYVTTDYVGVPNLCEAAKKMRPDLEFIDPNEALMATVYPEIFAKKISDLT